MKTVGLAKIERDNPEKNLRFAYLISRWLGVFAYLAAVWIGSFALLIVFATVMTSGIHSIDFVLNGVVSLLSMGTGVLGIVNILRGDLVRERVIIWPVIIGLTTSTTFYAVLTIQDILSNIPVSPLVGISGAILTGMIIYLVVRAFWINSTLDLANKNRYVVEKIEALEG